MTVTITFNSKCGTARNVLQIIRAFGEQLIEYLAWRQRRGQQQR